METIGLILFIATFVTPFITIPLAMRITELPKGGRLVIGILLALVFSFLFYHVSLGFIFHNGMGPG